MRISYWSSDVCSSDLKMAAVIIAYRSPDNYRNYYPFSGIDNPKNENLRWEKTRMINFGIDYGLFENRITGTFEWYFKRSEEHTSELQSLMRISYAVYCLHKKKQL